MLESYYKLQPKPKKTIDEFKDALQLIWSALSENNVNNAAKHFRELLQACVSATGRHFKQKMW